MNICVSASQMRELDRYTCENLTPSRELMRRAGLAAAEHFSGRAGSFAVVCGKGNNAGDGYVIALELHRLGKSVSLFLTEESFSTDGRYYFDACLAEGIAYRKIDESTDLSGFDNIVDCIYGIGFRGEVTGVAAIAVEKINSSGAFVVSIDINSGLDSDSGLSHLCVRSDLTVAVGFYKYGHFLGMARDVMKSRALADKEVGIPLLEGARHALHLESRDLSALFAKRQHFCNKGDFGYVTVMGGCVNYSGAVKLANLSLSALRSGCGVARLASPRSLAHSVTPYLLESTFYPLSDSEGYQKFNKDELDFIIKSSDAMALGMGWGKGPDNAKILTYILQNAELPLLIDADGLNTLAECPPDLLDDTKSKVILTPHPGEAARLCKISTAEVLADPVSIAESFARAHKVTLLLKGSATVIADPESTYIVDSGCAGMASAGSGDVLSGVILGLMGYNEPCALTAAAGAYLCGLAGSLAEGETGDIGAVASDTVKMIPQAILKIRDSSKEI